MDFGIGFLEIVLILVVALLVLGPGKVMDVARSLGKLVRSVKNMSSDFTTQISKELEEDKKAPPQSTDKPSKL